MNPFCQLVRELRVAWERAAGFLPEDPGERGRGWKPTPGPCLSPRARAVPGGLGRGISGVCESWHLQTASW